MSVIRKFDGLMFTFIDGCFGEEFKRNGVRFSPEWGGVSKQADEGGNAGSLARWSLSHRARRRDATQTAADAATRYLVAPGVRHATFETPPAS
jgi:hypothetical protein